MITNVKAIELTTVKSCTNISLCDALIKSSSISEFISCAKFCNESWKRTQTDYDLCALKDKHIIISKLFQHLKLDLEASL